MVFPHFSNLASIQTLAGPSVQNSARLVQVTRLEIITRDDSRRLGLGRISFHQGLISSTGVASHPLHAFIFPARVPVLPIIIFHPARTHPSRERGQAPSTLYHAPSRGILARDIDERHPRQRVFSRVFYTLIEYNIKQSWRCWLGYHSWNERSPLDLSPRWKTTKYPRECNPSEIPSTSRVYKFPRPSRLK